MRGVHVVEAFMTYLRMTIAKWSIDVYSAEAEAIFHKIATEGVKIFKAQPGFIRYRLMRADTRTTIAVAEWESQMLGKPGAQAYRDWMRESGITDKIALETYDGDIVAAS